MDPTVELRKKVKKYVDQADEKSLLVVAQMLEKEEGEHWWDELPTQVKKMYPQWFKK